MQKAPPFILLLKSISGRKDDTHFREIWLSIKQLQRFRKPLDAFSIPAGRGLETIYLDHSALVRGGQTSVPLLLFKELFKCYTIPT